jgi:DNA polymerase (family 10)
MDKKEIAEVFEEIALLLEMKGENPFRVRAYRNAARSLLNTEKDLKKMIREGSLTDLEGIGGDLAEKIEALATKGRLPFYEKLKRSMPKGLLQLREVPGLGAKKIKVLHEKLKIDSLASLEKACKEGKIAKLPGFGKKTEANILAALGAKEAYAKRRLWTQAMELAEPILAALKKAKGVKRAEIAGSLRRKLETIGDLDFLAASSNPKATADWFASQPFVSRVLAKGETKVSVALKGGCQADLRIVSEEQFGFALLYFTGSKEHNVRFREKVRKMGGSLSEYELTPLDQRARLPKLPRNPDEEAIYEAFGFSYIPPELRENIGEFEAAAKGKIPHLIEEKDLRGALHCHTTASDGKDNLADMVRGAEKLGWDYIGISDHSKSSFQANGLSIERLEEQMDAIRKLNASKKFSPHIFAGSECDILADGKLDFPDSVLKKLDFAIVSIHSSLSQDEKTTTKRLIRAIENPYSTIVGHVTGRLLLKREPYKVNVQKVIDACIANKKIIELNGHPMRLDMDWRFWRSASEKGLLCCINPDAHSTGDLLYVNTGVNAARKGWLQKKNVVNTLSLSQIQKLLKQMRA